MQDPSATFDVGRVPAFSRLDGALRCQICKDRLDAPVLTACCCHAFCSSCIRHALASNSECPVCRTNTQPSALRRCPNLQDAVDAFMAVIDWASSTTTAIPTRPDQPVETKSRYSFATDAQPQRSTAESKRSASDAELSPDAASVQAGRPRQRRAAAIAASAILTSSAASRSRPAQSANTVAAEPEPEPDGSGQIVPCPMCGRQMKALLVYSHLDSCPGPASTPTLTSTPTPTSTSTSIHPSASTLSGSRRGPPPAVPSARTTRNGRINASSSSTAALPVGLPQIAPIAQLNYSILSETALRKKMRELGIPTTGNKQVLIRRHSEWVVLHNANCDARRPKPTRELLRLLDQWEKLQGPISGIGAVAPAATGAAAVLFSQETTVATFHTRTAASGGPTSSSAPVLVGPAIPPVSSPVSGSQSTSTAAISATGLGSALPQPSSQPAASSRADVGPNPATTLTVNSSSGPATEAESAEYRQKCSAATEAARGWASRYRHQFAELIDHARKSQKQEIGKRMAEAQSSDARKVGEDSLGVEESGGNETVEEHGESVKDVRGSTPSELQPAQPRQPDKQSTIPPPAADEPSSTPAPVADKPDTANVDIIQIDDSFDEMDDSLGDWNISDSEL